MVNFDKTIRAIDRIAKRQFYQTHPRSTYSHCKIWDDCICAYGGDYVELDDMSVDIEISQATFDSEIAMIELEEKLEAKEEADGR